MNNEQTININKFCMTSYDYFLFLLGDFAVFVDVFFLLSILSIVLLLHNLKYLETKKREIITRVVFKLLFIY